MEPLKYTTRIFVNLRSIPRVSSAEYIFEYIEKIANKLIKEYLALKVKLFFKDNSRNAIYVYYFTHAHS